MRKFLHGLAWTLSVALMAYQIYLVSGNGLLNTPLGTRALNRRPERFQIDWRHGLTWWPGRLALWGVEIQVHGRRNAWRARARHARGHIALLPLLRRELHMPAIWGREIDVELDRAAGNVPPPSPRPAGWTLRFDRIATDSLRRLRWSDPAFELRGVGNGVLALVKQIRGALEIRPSRLTMQRARCTMGGVELARNARIDLHLAIARHRRDEAAGWRKLGLTEATLAVDATTPALAVSFDDAGHWHAAIRPDAPRGRLEGRLALADGALRPGGSLTLHMPLRAASPGGVSWESRADLQAAVDDGVHVRLRVPRPPDGFGNVDADLHLATRRLPLDATWRAPLDQLSGTVDLSWHFETLSWLSPLLVKAPWLTLEGAGRVDAALRIQNGRLADGSRLSVPEVTVNAQVLDNLISGSARADARLDVGTEGLVTQTEITIGRFRMAPADEPDLDYVDGTNLRLDLVSSGQLADFRETLQAALRFDDARVGDLRVYNRYLPGRALRLLGGSGRLSGSFDLDAAGRVGAGRLQLVGRNARLALGDLTLSGDLQVDGRLARADLEDRTFDLDGTTVRLTDMRATGAAGELARNWWTRIALPRGRVLWGHPLRIEGRADATLKDVGPLLALFTRHRDYPRWVLRLVDAGQTRISTNALLQGEELVLDRLAAANERFELEARLRVGAGPPAGDLYLRWGLLRLGLEMRNGERDFHTLRPARWYRSRPGFLPASGPAGGGANDNPEKPERGDRR